MSEETELGGVDESKRNSVDPNNPIIGHIVGVVGLIIAFANIPYCSNIANRQEECDRLESQNELLSNDVKTNIDSLNRISRVSGSVAAFLGSQLDTLYTCEKDLATLNEEIILLEMEILKLKSDSVFSDAKMSTLQSQRSMLLRKQTTLTSAIAKAETEWEIARRSFTTQSVSENNIQSLLGAAQTDYNNQIIENQQLCKAR